MSSIQGMPMQGSDVTAVITRVHLHPLCVLVEFWAKFSQQSKADYQHIASNIQSPGAVFKELEGNPGDQCLVKIDDTWHRSRIVSRNGFNYQVFLIDKGITCSATTSMLAWGKKEYFQVPPEVEFCVLANVLPRAQEKRWSPMAQEYLKSFTGKSVAAHVQDILVSHKIFLLHIPSISTQMYEMGFARKLSPAMFLDFVLLTLKSPSGGEAPPETMQLFREAIHGQQKQELFVYPELSVENTTAVTVTEVISPKRIFCQLKIFSKELKRLSEKLTQSCEGRRVRCILCPEMIGCPYAAKGNDGQWYRSVVQQLFPTNALVEVLNVDYGTKQFVPVENIRELPAEFFRMPVFTYSCSLHGITDKGSGWEVRQINFLRSLLLHKTVSAHFQYHVISEGVYSVTLYGDHNTNLNKLFGSREGCLLEGDKTVARYSIQSITSTKQHLTPETTRENHVRNGDECFLLDNLPLNSSHLAVVHHVISPSEFWIQTETYRKELDKLLDNICHLHKGSVNTDVKDLIVGLYCVAKAKDDNFYRVSVCEVGNAKVKVFFVDYGNTEVVDKNDIRSLPPEFKELPKLALKCTLASVGPTDGRWNDSATEFFTKVVIDKLLNIQVKAKNADGYVVQLTDPNAQSEQDVGRLMCNFGHAKWLEVIQPSVVMPPAHVNGNLPACRDDKVQPQTKGGFGIKEAPLFKARMFSIGSVLEVTVSYIESPNDFWCQLVQNMKHLQLLMGDLQYHYANSEFQHDAETSCVAQHPSNGMWYRALVVRRHKTPHVDVLFVDYGHTETVSISALRKISPEFLTLDGQAFRCSLLNLTDPTTLVNNWKEEAKAKFLNFVKTAASNFGILKCTVYAVMYNKQRTLYNVVDLETPFESICSIMANLVSSPPPQKPNGQSASLCTYYYSTHNIKVGTEEQVTVTCVDSVNHFYCHLDKNQDVIKELSMKLNSLCNQLLKVKFPKVFASLCFAKYTDGQWYRAQIKQTKPALLVHFVDYGDTIEVDKSDLIPIPKEANDILSVPIQAVLCGLADVPPDVSSEADQWFASAVAGCKFKGLVVAKEPDGKLLVELYHGNSQINFDIKNMFLNKAQKKQQSHKDFQPPEEQTLRTARGFSEQAASKSSFSVCAGVLGSNRPSVNLKSSEKNENGFCDSMKKMRRAPSELYKPPHQRTSNNTKPDTASKNAEVSGNQRSDDLSPETKFVLSEWSRTESQQEVDGGKVPQLPELPPSRITAGLRVDVYVSHYNSPLSFYVQRIDEEEELFSLVEQLNDPEWTQKDSPIQDVHVGDLVLAEFSEDSSWYRAVVKEIQEEHTALIEFVDFGNTAEAPVSNMRRLQQPFLQLPAYSTHCMLGDAEGLGLRMLDPEVVSLFREELGVGGEKVLRCCFIKRVGSVWEVSLEDGGVAVGCKVPDVVTEEHEEEEPTRGGQKNILSVDAPEFVLACSVKKKSFSELFIKEDRGTSRAPMTAKEAIQLFFQKANPQATSQTLLDVSEKIESSQRPCVEGRPSADVGTEWSRTESQQEVDGGKVPQLPELPPSRITAGLRVDVYVSHYNSPLSFYVQRIDEEEELFSLVEQLNDPEWTQKDSPIQDVHVGDLVLAEFSEDSSWYRAVVKEIQEEHTALIEFVDFGNTAEAPVSNMRRLQQSFLQLPAYSTHCMLGDAEGLGLRMLDPEVVSLFREELGVGGEKVLRCCFIKRVGSVWEVSLEDGGVAVGCKVPDVVTEEHEEEEPTRGGRKNILSVDAPEFVLACSAETKLDLGAFMEKMKTSTCSLEKTCFSEPITEENYGTACVPLSARRAIQTTESSQRSCVEDEPTADVGTEWSRTESQQEVDAGKVPQLPELPPSTITAGLRVDVYVSHYNSPLSFYVQRVDEEEELFSLVEQLNDPEWTQKDSPIQDVHVGDLVLAEFSEDSSWYRAVVKEIQEEHTALIEFVDFGNTAEAPVSNMRRLQQSFLQLPAYSTHCMLGDAEGLGLRMLDPEVVSLFREELGVGGEKVLRCCFIKRVGSVWEVSLEDGGVAVGCKVPDVVTEEHEEEEEPTNIPAVTQEAEISEKSPVSVCSPHKEQECTEEQQLEEFIPTMKEKSLSGDSGVEEKTSGGKSPPPVDAPESECFDSSPYVVNDPETKVCDIEEKETSTCYLESENFTEPIQEKNEEDERITSVPSLTASRAVHMIPRKADLETSDPVLDVPKQLSFDSGVEEKPVQTEETSSPPVDAPESESLDLSQEKIGDDIDEPETRIEEKEASPCSSEIKSFSEPGEEKHEQEASEWRSFGKTSTAVQMVPQDFVIEEIKDPNVPEQDDESRGASTCVEESCPADFCTADLKDESPDGETLSQGSDDHLSAAAEEETSAVTFPCEAVGPEVKGGGDYIHDKLEKKESSGSSEESEEVHQDDASSLSVEDVFTGQEKSISGDECSGVQLSLTCMCMEDITAEVLPAEKLTEK
ncbi:muellerian-inhibiting factor [Oryzias latipes]|uniref:Anti-Mullerian hormone n=1 Tax=Oryzias latipes TaxID=8090 RepID=A0A3B3I6H0_ORYLA|nr:muellerian-inhibiting factor [Oryzias latipes]